METFGAGSIAARPMTITLADILNSQRKLQPLSESMKQAMLQGSFEMPTSSIGSLAKASFGWYSEMEKWLMKDPLAYMETPAGVAMQFQRITVMIDSCVGNPATAQSALQAFCQRMSNGPTLEALSKVVEFPVGSESAMILLLEYLLLHDGQPAAIQTLLRHLKAMEIQAPILEMCSRTFLWTDRGVRMAARDQIESKELYEEKIQHWSGKPTRVIKQEPKSLIDDGVLSIFLLKMKDTKLPVYYWILKLSEDGLVIAKGYAASLEAAAEQLYIAFYKALTKKRCVDAAMVQKGTQIVILGNWITNDEYMAYKHKANLQIVADASDDTRDDLIFVIGWPALGKQKALVEAHYVKKARNYGELTSDNVVIELRSGFVLNATHDFYVYRAEANILGEVMCMKCQKIGQMVHLGCIHVRGRGLLCGPCIDHLMGEDQLDDDAFDLTDVILPSDIQTVALTSEEDSDRNS